MRYPPDVAVTREQLEQFLARPWDRLRALKDRHHASSGPEESFRIAEMLREHARAMGAHQDEQARVDDLLAAVRLKRLLDRASGRR